MALALADDSDSDSGKSSLPLLLSPSLVEPSGWSSVNAAIVWLANPWWSSISLLNLARTHTISVKRLTLPPRGAQLEHQVMASTSSAVVAWEHFWDNCLATLSGRIQVSALILKGFLATHFSYASFLHSSSLCKAMLFSSSEWLGYLLPLLSPAL